MEKFRIENVKALFEVVGIEPGDFKVEELKDLISIYNHSVVMDLLCDESSLYELKYLFRMWYEALVAADGFDVAFPGAGKSELTRYEAWLDFLCRPDLDISFVYDELDEKFSLFWISGRQARTGMLNFSFAQRGRLVEKVEGGKWLLKKLFEICGYESIMGLTPELNHGAIRYAKAIGAEVIAKIPGACYNGHRVETGVLTLFLPEPATDDEL